MSSGVCEGYSKHYIGEVVGIEYEVENPDFAKITQYIPKKKNNAEYVTKVLEERYKAEHNIQSSSSYEADYGYAQTDYGDNRNDYANVDMGFNQAAEDAYYNDESRWGTGFSSEGYSDYDSQYNEYDSQYSDYSSQSKYSKNGMDAKKGSGTKDIVSALGILGLIGVCIAYYIYSYGLPI